MFIHALRVPLLAIASVLLLTACPRPEQPRDPVPPGVSVQPPRATPQAGGLVLPRDDADTPAVAPTGEFPIGGDPIADEPQPDEAEPDA